MFERPPFWPGWGPFSCLISAMADAVADETRNTRFGNAVIMDLSFRQMPTNSTCMLSGLRIYTRGELQR